MALQLPFGPQNSGTYSVADVDRRRKLAQQLLAGQQQSSEPFGALAQALRGAGAGYENSRAAEEENLGRDQFNTSLSALLTSPELTLGQIGEVAGNEWATPSQTALLSQLMGKEVGELYPDADVADGYFGSTLPYQNADGSLGYYQLQKGSPPILPEGARWLEPTTTVNTGTAQTVLGGRTGDIVTSIPIENEQASFDRELGGEMGGAAGKAAVAAPGDIAAGEMALNLIDQIRTDPRLPGSTGIGPAWGTNDPRVNPQGAGFQSIVEQAKSGAFLTAIQQMRGLGALSNAEGAAATAAITRLSTNLEDADFKKALDDYETLVRKGIDRAKRRVRVTEDGKEVPLDEAGASAPEAPKPGAVEDGYRFKGGDPADPKNWEKV